MTRNFLLQAWEPWAAVSGATLMTKLGWADPASGGRPFLLSTRSLPELALVREGSLSKVRYCLSSPAKAPSKLTVFICPNRVKLSAVCPFSLKKSCYNYTPLGERHMSENIATFWDSWRKVEIFFYYYSLFYYYHPPS